MKDWTLEIVIKRFDHFVTNVDFGNLPNKESVEYRDLLFKTANDAIFCDGRYSYITEMLLEMFDIKEVEKLTHSVKSINALSKEERVRFKFYMDLKAVCYPLFRVSKIDWTSWPWNMSDNRDTVLNEDLCKLLNEEKWANLSVVIIYWLKEVIWNSDRYTSVARQAASDAYENIIEMPFMTSRKKGSKDLSAAVIACYDELWEIENHMLVGQQLGFDHMTQEVYDAMNTIIVDRYFYNEIACARELGAWINANMKVGQRFPSMKKRQALHDKMLEVMAKHKVESPNLSHTWNIITLDALGMAMFAKEEYNDNDNWLEEDELGI